MENKIWSFYIDHYIQKLPLLPDMYRSFNLKLYITGTPGTGKSTLSKALKTRYPTFNVFEIKELLIKFDLLEEYEPERDTTIFDELKAGNQIHQFLKSKDDFILVGPALDVGEIPFSCIIVLTCSKKSILESRLKEREYDFSKINENLEAELLGEILGEILDIYDTRTKILALDSCTYSIQELISKIVENVLL